MADMQSVDPCYERVKIVPLSRTYYWVPAVSLALLFMLLLGCTAAGRQLGKKTTEPDKNITKSESKKLSKRDEAPAKNRDVAESRTFQEILKTAKQGKPGRTDLEIARDIAIGLAEKHAPVDQMRLCLAKKTGEWWITLFQGQGQILDLRQYIWNKVNEKLDPFCVEERIASDALEDYLNEQRRGTECTAFERTKKGWKPKKIRSSRPGSARDVKPSARTVLSVFPDEGIVIPALRLVSGADKELALRLTNVSTSPRGGGNDYVFVYGSEMNHRDLLRWLRTKGYDPELLVDASSGRLEGYGYVWNYYSAVKGGGTANIEPRENSVVWGLVLEMDTRLVSALDQKQGSPVSYSRGSKRIPVRRIEDGRTVLAWVYTAKPNRDGRTDVWPTQRYKRQIIEAASFWGFPRPYLDRIRLWHTRR